MTLHAETVLLAIMIVLSAFFAMSETALLSLSKFKVRHWFEKKRFGSAYVKKLKDNPEILLSTILIGNNLVNTAAAAIATSIALQIFQHNAIGIATGIATFLILIFGDVIPKSIGTNNNEILAPIIAPVIWNLSIAIYPLTKTLEYFLKGINKLVGAKKIPIVTEEELKSIVKASEEEGSIKEIEKKMIQRIFDFDNTTVADVMTRKKSMVSVSSDMQIKDVLQLPNVKMYSRFPVYEKNKDNIVGILYLKDMLRFVKDNKLDINVKQVMRKPFFVFESKKMDAMLRLFQNRKQHMAIVISEKAQVVGLVTIENILEEMVGEIIDESDRINPSIMQLSKSEWVAKGSTEIEDINAKTGMTVKASDYIDLDGFIAATLGRYPKLGEEINYQNYKIIMEDVQGKKVVQARVVRV
ncbi:HlyC/CorC family transporter [Candidatus Woesearchaeota archaeon]|nr:HlyC/CorC family transporter [Candidatus Woesearchaeota archaeon]